MSIVLREAKRKHGKPRFSVKENAVFAFYVPKAIGGAVSLGLPEWLKLGLPGKRHSSAFIRNAEIKGKTCLSATCPLGLTGQPVEIPQSAAIFIQTYPHPVHPTA